MYPAVYYRLTLLVLLGLLSSCSVYDQIFHPHRLGTPPMTANAKAKAKAAEKARHKGLTLGTPEATKSDAADGSSPDGATPATDARNADDKNKAIANMLGNTYDKKTGLLKRSKLQRLDYSRRALHHYDLSAPKHTDATRDERKMRKHSKNPKGKDAPEHREPKEPTPAPDPTQPTAKSPKAAPRRAAAEPATQPEPPAAAPTPAAAPDEPPLAPRSNPGKFKSDKKSKKSNKYPKGYKPDPTQPQDGN